VKDYHTATRQTQTHKHLYVYTMAFSLERAHSAKKLTHEKDIFA